MGVVASTTVGVVTTPLVQLAWVTVGDTGCTGTHVTLGNDTMNVAVVSLTLVHPVGKVVGHATPVPVSVAVTVTFWAGVAGYVPAGLPAGVSVYVTPCVVAVVMWWVFVVPATHCAGVTDGAAGLIVVHDPAMAVSGKVAVVLPVLVQPWGNVPQATPVAANVAVTVTFNAALPVYVLVFPTVPSGVHVYVMLAVLVGTVMTWGVTAPATHDAACAVGVPGCTGVQLAAAACRRKVAVVLPVRVHPVGSVVGHPAPAPTSVAVTVTSSAAVPVYVLVFPTVPSGVQV